MQSDLKENNQAIAKFNTDVDTSLVTMSQSLNVKFRQAKEYQDKVRERMDDLDHKVFKSYDPLDAPLPSPGSTRASISLLPPQGGRSIPELERERTKMELDLTSDILGFNQRVAKQITDLERSVMGEISSLQDELRKEEKRRTENDKELLSQVGSFLTGL